MPIVSANLKNVQRPTIYKLCKGHNYTYMVQVLLEVDQHSWINQELAVMNFEQMSFVIGLDSWKYRWRLTDENMAVSTSRIDQQQIIKLLGRAGHKIVLKTYLK